MGFDELETKLSHKTCGCHPFEIAVKLAKFVVNNGFVDSHHIGMGFFDIADARAGQKIQRPANAARMHAPTSKARDFATVLSQHHGDTIALAILIISKDNGEFGMGFHALRLTTPGQRDKLLRDPPG